MSRSRNAEPKFDAERRTILEVVVGSRAYGTATDASDTDMAAVVVPPVTDYLGFEPFSVWRRDDRDHTTFSLRRFMDLLARGAHNAVEMLWVEPEDIVRASPEGEKLIAMRERFLTNKLAQSIVGYTLSFAVEAFLKNPSPVNQMRFHNFGYDTKKAMHALRAMRTAREMLEEGVMRVRRPDAAELLAIRNGSIERDAMARFEGNALVGGLLFEERRRLDVALLASTLPEAFTHEEAEPIAIELALEFENSL